MGMRPQEWSSLGMVSLTDCAQCMQMSSFNVGLDYNSTVMLTCKLLLAAAKAIVDIGPDMPWQSQAMSAWEVCSSSVQSQLEVILH